MRLIYQTHPRKFCFLFCGIITGLMLLPGQPAFPQDTTAKPAQKAESQDKKGAKQTNNDTIGSDAVSPKAAPDDKSDSKPGDKSPPAVNPGRPTITGPAALSAPGWLETEFGIQQDLNQDRIFGTSLLFKLTDRNHRFQYRLSSDGYLRLGDCTDGIGDT